MSMWVVYEKKTISKTLTKIPKIIIAKYEAWKRIVEISGPTGLKLVKGFHDEALSGKWKGYRSSRLDLQWRVIYKIEKNILRVYVFEITPHKY